MRLEKSLNSRSGKFLAKPACFQTGICCNKWFKFLWICSL